MVTAAKTHWDAALRRVCTALVGAFDSPDILERSRERVQDARAALERAPQRPRRRTVVGLASPPVADARVPERNYFALFLDAHGIVSTQRLLASDDDEATARAQVQADERAFDVWDGWRFIGGFEPAVPQHRVDDRAGIGPSWQHPRRGRDEPGDSQDRHEQGESNH